MLIVVSIVQSRYLLLGLSVDCRWQSRISNVIAPLHHCQSTTRHGHIDPNSSRLSLILLSHLADESMKSISGSFDRSFKVECDAPVRITPSPRHVAVPFISPHYIIRVPSTTPNLISWLGTSPIVHCNCSKLLCLLPHQQ
jgi:hypothetical protein